MKLRRDAVRMAFVCRQSTVLPVSRAGKPWGLCPIPNQSIASLGALDLELATVTFDRLLVANNDVSCNNGCSVNE